MEESDRVKGSACSATLNSCIDLPPLNFHGSLCGANPSRLFAQLIPSYPTWLACECRIKKERDTQRALPLRRRNVGRDWGVTKQTRPGVFAEVVRTRSCHALESQGIVRVRLRELNDALGVDALTQAEMSAEVQPGFL